MSTEKHYFVSKDGSKAIRVDGAFRSMKEVAVPRSHLPNFIYGLPLSDLTADIRMAELNGAGFAILPEDGGGEWIVNLKPIEGDTGYLISNIRDPRMHIFNGKNFVPFAPLTDEDHITNMETRICELEKDNSDLKLRIKSLVYASHSH